MSGRIPEIVIGFLLATALFCSVGIVHGDFLHDITAPEFVNLALVLVTIALWWATRQLVKGSEAASERQLRAYLGISGWKLTPDRGTLELILKNSGQTPASDVIGHINWFWLPVNQELPPDFPYPDYNVPDARSNPTAWPNAEISYTFQIDMHRIGEAATESITLFFYGHFDYKDIFNHKKTTTFCMKVLPGPLPKGGGLRTFGKHNFYT